VNFQQSLRENAERIERYLQKICDGLHDAEVNRAVKYSLLSGGKRLRPSFAYETALMFGVNDDDNVVRIAAALEMIHTYSLIHDDLPCMDDDDFRRGKPSCHKAFGAGMAVLAGDALLNLAYETLLGGKYSESYFKACKYIADCAGAGSMGMVAGQSDDISNAPKDTVDLLIKLTEKKTSALFVAPMLAVGIYLNRPRDTDLWHLCGIGAWFGNAFQVADDLLDSTKRKPQGFVKVLGESGARAKMNEFSEKAVNSCREIGFNADFFLELVAYNLTRSK